jgi:inositol-phosphate transport system ATP-binding protein
VSRIEFRNIRKNFGPVTAIEEMNFVIEDGEFVAILGPSGCGKSTSLFLLAGIYTPTEGELRFDDAVVNEVESRDRNVGIVFQSYALYPSMSVIENIMFPLKFKNLSKEQARTEAEAIARLVEIEDLLDRRPAQLSGGQQQRVALARALVKRPQLLLLDEPLSNLDATLRLSMRTEIKSLQNKLGITTILVTHDQIEATTMADRIICMNMGRIEQIGTADDLYIRPASKFVASFIGSPPINMWSADRRDGELVIGTAACAYSGEAMPDNVSVGIRPEHIRFSKFGLPAQVTQAEPMGREILYVVKCAFGTAHVLELGNVPSHRIGEHAMIEFDPENTLVYDRDSGVLIAQARVSMPADGGT